MKFIHLSDLHFHRRKRDNKNATKILEFIKKNYPKHYLILTGDIVDDGHEEQYKRAFEALKPFIGRIFICPGNHDFGAAGNFYSLERADRFDEMLAMPLQQSGTFSKDNTPVVNIVEEKNDRVMLIALDTNLETDHPFDFACGIVGDKQLESLGTILMTSHEILKVLFFHHHLFINNHPFMELKDAAKLMRVIFNHVDIVLFGHKHVSNQWDKYGGFDHVLASDDSPGKKFAREVTISNGKIEGVADLPIS